MLPSPAGIERFARESPGLRQMEESFLDETTKDSCPGQRDVLLQRRGWKRNGCMRGSSLQRWRLLPAEPALIPESFFPEMSHTHTRIHAHTHTHTCVLVPLSLFRRHMKLTLTSPTSPVTLTRPKPDSIPDLKTVLTSKQAFDVVRTRQHVQKCPHLASRMSISALSK